MFIAFEGLDGSGKSTQSARLVARLRSAGYSVVEVRDPGGTPLGDHLRETLKHGCLPMCSMAEMKLFNASRSQMLCDVVRPALADGKIVVADRYTMSTVVYQGHVGGLCLEDVRTDCRIATSEKTPSGSRELRPDRTFVFDVPAKVAMDRCDGTDRFESRGIEFFRQLAAGYRIERTLLLSHGEPIVRLPGESSPDEIAAIVWETVEAMLAVRVSDDEAA